MKDMKSALVGVSLLVGSIGSTLPGLSYYESHGPPIMDKSIALLATGGALVLLMLGFTNKRLPKTSLPRQACKRIIGAVVLIVVYQILLNYMTVTPPPPKDDARIQIGFYTLEWSLTNDAVLALKAHPELHSPLDLMLAFGAFDGNLPNDIWKPWTIITAGLILTVIFVLAFCSWAYGFGLLSRYIAPSSSDPKRRTDREPPEKDREPPEPSAPLVDADPAP